MYFNDKRQNIHELFALLLHVVSALFHTKIFNSKILATIDILDIQFTIDHFILESHE